jgi:hypothetical protein
VIKDVVPGDLALFAHGLPVPLTEISVGRESSRDVIAIWILALDLAGMGSLAATVRSSLISPALVARGGSNGENDDGYHED